MKYYLKQPLFIIMYTFIFSLLGFGLSLLNIQWLQIAAGIGIMAFYCVVTGIIFYIEGRESYKTLHANDLDRIQIVKTGEDIPLDINKEYKPYKGFVMGAIGMIPAILLAIVHGIVLLATGGTFVGVGSALTICYSGFWIFITGVADIKLLQNPSQAFIVLYCIPLTIIVSGVAYIIGGIRQRKIYEIARQTHDKIYGVENKENQDGEEDYSEFQDYTQEVEKLKAKKKEGRK